MGGVGDCLPSLGLSSVGKKKRVVRQRWSTASDRNRPVRVSCR